MIGAILGDVVGSRFEFDNHKSKEFELFHPECCFTDDTVLTLAIAKALLPYDRITDYEQFKKELVTSIREIGMRYTDCGYGGRFYYWLTSGKTEPYNSSGNGAAMGVSPVAWFPDTLESCEKLPAATAEVTHNHPEGVKGAVAVAGAAFLARTGHTMTQIKEYVAQYYTVDFTPDEIRDSYGFYETCQQSVPQAFSALFASTDFEDAIRTAVSIGGDSDTIGAMVGAVAEAFYGIPEDMKETALSYLDLDLLKIAEDFTNKFMNKE